MADTQIERIMRGLKCSREEAEQILADDKAIDRGERMSFDLDKEKEKGDMYREMLSKVLEGLEKLN